MEYIPMMLSEYERSTSLDIQTKGQKLAIVQFNFILMNHLSLVYLW
jgi:hypothetical protein